jgi:hypothetical protein
MAPGFCNVIAEVSGRISSNISQIISWKVKFKRKIRSRNYMPKIQYKKQRCTVSERLVPVFCHKWRH